MHVTCQKALAAGQLTHAHTVRLDFHPAWSGRTLHDSGRGPRRTWESVRRHERGTLSNSERDETGLGLEAIHPSKNRRKFGTDKRRGLETRGKLKNEAWLTRSYQTTKMHNHSVDSSLCIPPSATSQR